MNPSRCLSLFLTISLIFNSHAIIPKSNSNLYKNVCKDAGKDNQRCLKLLSPNPKITSAKDYLTLSKLFLEMAIEKATKGQDYLKTLIKEFPSSHAIKNCATSDYDGLVMSFRSSLGELVVDPISANYDARVAGDGPQACDRELANEKIVNPSVSKMNNEMTFLSDVAYLATNYLRK
ncbi:hypothetical protein KIW84_076030 [Lathyrus oleraceus]|uniref:Pectinesterase inhibitor domain-containing protein n=2 Tax=Pisum sativum TaxID=3888 RepID=A0A9D4VWX8_PEA|nr:hypothetical protein KIW84_076030 [Pisum sativum]